MSYQHPQQGGVLIISLIILSIMTLLGVSAMTHSSLQERMVGNQKQAIQAAMAAEAGAIWIVGWLRNHPEVWSDSGSWKPGEEFLAGPANEFDFGDGIQYWIERIDFKGDVAVVLCKGGVFSGEQIVAQRTVTVVLQRDHLSPESASLKMKTKFGMNAYSRDRLLSLNTSSSYVVDGEHVEADNQIYDIHAKSNLLATGINDFSLISVIDPALRPKRPAKLITWSVSSDYRQ